MSEPDNVLQPYKENSASNTAITIPIESTPVSSFESELFRDGPYVFDEYEFSREKLDDLKEYMDWLEEVRSELSPDTQELHIKSLLEMPKSLNIERLWREHFSGKIPKSWGGPWYNVIKDFEKAAKARVQLSEVLVDAGLSYPNQMYVAMRVATSQRLNTRQLSWVLLRPDFPKWAVKDIYHAQKNMGMSDEEWQKAIDLANSIKEKDTG